MNSLQPNTHQKGVATKPDSPNGSPKKPDGPTQNYLSGIKIRLKWKGVRTGAALSVIIPGWVFAQVASSLLIKIAAYWDQTLI